MLEVVFNENKACDIMMRRIFRVDKLWKVVVGKSGVYTRNESVSDFTFHSSSTRKALTRQRRKCQTTRTASSCQQKFDSIPQHSGPRILLLTTIFNRVMGYGVITLGYRSSPAVNKYAHTTRIHSPFSGLCWPPASLQTFKNSPEGVGACSSEWFHLPITDANGGCPVSVRGTFAHVRTCGLVGLADMQSYSRQAAKNLNKFCYVSSQAVTATQHNTTQHNTCVTHFSQNCLICFSDLSHEVSGP